MKLATLPLILTTAGLAHATVLPLSRRQQPTTSPLLSTENGAVLEVEVHIDNQTFYLVPDTGSSDLWVPVTNFQCVDREGLDVPQEDCLFGATYRVPSSTEYVANQTFGVQYGTGKALGRVAYADVTLNGVQVKRQKIGLVDRTSDVGDGVGSGILGLGFPTLTSAHPGTTLDNETLLVNRAVYDPLFVSMYKQGVVEPWYSFAIERPPKNATTGPGGWLGLGELPPVPHSNDWAIKPIEVTEGLPDELTGGRREISLMTLTVDGIVWRTASQNSTATDSTTTSTMTNSTAFQAVVDTGNHMNLFPSAIADAINSAFDPPGVFEPSLHVYIVDCNATTPHVGVVLDGHTFWHRLPEDLIYRDASTGLCYSSVGPTGEGSGLALNFLGDAFLRTVVSVFDFGKAEMRFAARIDGNSTAPPVYESAAVRLGSLCWWGMGFVSVVAWLCF